MKRTRTPPHKVNKRQRADAIAALSKIVGSGAQPYVVAKAASALLNAAVKGDGDAPDRDDDDSWRPVFLPPKNGDAAVRYGHWHEDQRVFIVPDGFAREIRPEAFYKDVPKPAPIAARVLALPAPGEGE